VAAAVPRRGEPGFAAAARASGGDPRAQQAPIGRLQPVQPSPPTQAPSGRQRAPGGRQRGVVDRVGAARVPLGGGVTIDDGAGLLLGVFAWAVALQYFRGGMPQVQKFLAAKFLNKPG